MDGLGGSSVGYVQDVGIGPGLVIFDKVTSLGGSILGPSSEFKVDPKLSSFVEASKALLIKQKNFILCSSYHRVLCVASSFIF